MNKNVKISKISKLVSLILACSVLFSSCVSTTMIRSNPSGAKVYLDGQLVGTTPYRHSDTKIVGTVTTVTLEKEGYEPFHTMFSRTEQPDIGAIIGGIFVYIPLLWLMKYNPEHTYELIPYDAMQEVQEQTGSQQQSAPDIHSKAEKLRELKKLLDEKIITQEEFEKEKKKILDQEE